MPRNPYTPHGGIAMMQKWIATLKDKTGRSLDEWKELIAKKAPKGGPNARRDWLKAEYGLGTNIAMSLVQQSDGTSIEHTSNEAYLAQAPKFVDAMFSGKKAALRPVYDTLLDVCLAVGKEAKASPGKTAVPLYRKHVFAQIKPATNTRIDLGLALGNMKTPKRLVDTGGYEKKDRITRRIEVTSVADIDADLKKWLKTAYDLDA